MTRPRQPKLRCPLCKELAPSRVLDARPLPNRRVFSRRRKCKACGGKFWTSEAVDTRKPHNI